MRALVVPVKGLRTAKARLSGVLGPEERERLAWAMLQDVLEAVASAQGLDRKAVVTSDPEAAELARRFGLEVVPCPGDPGESAAVEMAARYLQGQGVQAMLVLPADVPLVTTGDIQAVLEEDPVVPGVVLVPSRDGTGSNAVLRRPPGVIGSHFGGDSFRLHRQEAQARGVQCRVLHLPRVALDVDTPEDLAQLVAQGQGSRAYRTLEQMGVVSRLARR